jgi:hypothetical protein
VRPHWSRKERKPSTIHLPGRIGNRCRRVWSIAAWTASIVETLGTGALVEAMDPSSDVPGF